MADKIYRVKDLCQVCHNGVWYYEGDCFKSSGNGLDLSKVTEEKGSVSVTERGEQGTVPHFVPEKSIEKKTKPKPADVGMEE